MPEIRHRIQRSLTAAERQRHERIRAEVEQQKQAIKARGRAALRVHGELQDAMRNLKALREKRGLSLAEVSRRSGIDRSRLSRLENDPAANPTLETLNRIATGIGVDLRIVVVG